MSLLTNLVGYWKMDEASGNALDSFGSDPMTEVNGPIASVTGKINQGRIFSNTQAFTHTSNSAFQVSGDFTWSVWFNMYDASFGTMPMFDKGITPYDFQNQEYLLRYDSGNGLLEFFVGNGTTYGSVSSLSSAGSIINVWHLVIVWYDSVAQTLNMQLDHDAGASVSWTGGLQTGTEQVVFGGLTQGSYLFSGSLDEIGFWKRALTSAERDLLWNGGAGYPFSSFGPVALHVGSMLTMFQ
jgi:hypothetical protein